MSLCIKHVETNTAFNTKSPPVNNLSRTEPSACSAEQRGRIHVGLCGVRADCWTDRPACSSQCLGGQLGVAGWGEAPAQVLEDVKGQAADQRDDGHLPQERQRGDEVHVWHGPRAESRMRHASQSFNSKCQGERNDLWGNPARRHRTKQILCSKRNDACGRNEYSIIQTLLCRQDLVSFK